jgi:DNA ligase (NAD+)
LELSAERKKQNFEIDGLVIKVNDLSKREEMGYTAKYPKGSISYKFEATEEVTTLNDVKWEVGRTGRVTPIAQLEPVDFGGVVVTKATLNNLLDIETKGVSIGAEVFIRRSNDVIPEIMGVVPGSVGTPIVHPETCPSCGEPTVVEMPFVWCKNTENCTAQSVKMWSHFVSRDALNIDGLSEKTLETMLMAKKMTKVSDMFYLKKEDLMELDRFGSKKIDNLLESIEKAKETTWEHFLYALGINLVGKGTAERTNKVFPGYEELKNATYEQLILIDDVGEKVAEEIVNYFSKQENLEEIERMIEAGVTFKVEEKKETTGEYTDKIFVLTGKMVAPRKEMEEKIKSMGGTIGSSVGKKTDFLIYGDDAGTKLEKAAKLGVQTIAEKDFFN